MYARTRATASYIDALEFEMKPYSPARGNRRGVRLHVLLFLEVHATLISRDATVLCYR